MGRQRQWILQLKSLLHKNDIEMYSTHNEGKSDFAERFIRTLNNKIFKYDFNIKKCVYWDKVDNIVNKYNYHGTTKMTLADVKSSTYIDCSKDNNEKDPKCKIGDIVRISKYKNIFAKMLHSKLVWRSFCD